MRSIKIISFYLRKGNTLRKTAQRDQVLLSLAEFSTKNSKHLRADSG